MQKNFPPGGGSSADHGNNTSLDETVAEEMEFAWREYRQSRRLRHVVKNDDVEEPRN
jgi:hypothetical protein